MVEQGIARHRVSSKTEIRLLLILLLDGVSQTRQGKREICVSLVMISQSNIMKSIPHVENTSVTGG